MSSFTETTTLDEVSINRADGTVKVIWRDHLFKDGVEVDSARVARDKTYSLADGKADFEADLGADADQYKGVFA